MYDYTKWSMLGANKMSLEKSYDKLQFGNLVSQKFHPNNKNLWKYQCGNFRTKTLVWWYFNITLNLPNLKQKTIKWICLENRYYDLCIYTSLSQTYIVQKGWKVSSQRYALIIFWCFLCKNLSQFTKKLLQKIGTFMN